MAQVAMVNSSNFNTEVMQASEPVLIDFWGDNCAPCKMMVPVLERLAQKFEGQLKIVKCNAIENQELAMQYGVMNMPTFLLLKNGQVVEQLIGA
ncbi:MAG: thioredoxin, partial [Abitibacteriaceae bacterium]|nr:thioredoxin [Abditibacteriaceae bacterium]